MKNIKELSLEFPIVIIGPNQTIETCQKLNGLLTTTKSGYRKQIQVNNQLIDSKGLFIKTVKVEIKQQLTPKWKLWVTNPLLEINLFGTQEISHSFEEFKSEVIELLRINSEFWEMNIALETLIQRIKNSFTFKDLIYILNTI